MVLIGCILGGLSLSQIWGLFGAANQLLAGIALMAVAAWLGDRQGAVTGSIREPGKLQRCTHLRIRSMRYGSLQNQRSRPRDYLSSFLLYAMIGLAFIGVVAGAFTGTVAFDIPAFTSWEPKAGQTLFPMLFITVACGACPVSTA